MTDQPEVHPGFRRWRIAASGTILQVGLGTVYAWSYFHKLIKVHLALASDSPVALVFGIAILFLGLSAAVGGQVLARTGPRKLALLGAILYALGWILGGIGLHVQSLPILAAGYGIVGGIGLGLGYVTPVATAAKWFPDRKGLVTGMVLMGFGFGALFLSKVIAPWLMHLLGEQLDAVFIGCGIVVALLCIPAAASLANPPSARQEPELLADPSRPREAPRTLGNLQRMLSWRFARLWFVFFCNICAGIMFIGFQSPLLQEILKRKVPEMTRAELAAAGATLIALSSLCNGLGRITWGALADKIGRANTFRTILATHALALLCLCFVDHPLLFSLLTCCALLCYGGGFGTMPSLVLDTYGTVAMPVMYGAVLTAWSVAGIVGPQLIAIVQDQMPAHGSVAAFGVGAVLLMAGFVTALWVRDSA